MRDLAPISLDLFEPDFGRGEYEWGCAAMHDGKPWKEHQYHVEFLSWHYHDYMGTHAFVQIWDYAAQDDPDQRWQFLLLRHEPTRIYNDDGAITGSTWAWTIARQYPGREDHRGPTHAEVGADIDAWMKNPNPDAE